METTLPPYPQKSGFRTATAIIRYVLGLPLIIFGLDMFLHFMPQPQMIMPPRVVAFSTALMNTGYMMPLIGVTFLVVGTFLVLNRFVPLALALFAPFMVNSLLFHAVLDVPSHLIMPLVFAALEIYLAWAYRNAFRPMLTARVTPG